jgi:hypothetical protein
MHQFKELTSDLEDSKNGIMHFDEIVLRDIALKIA